MKALMADVRRPRASLSFAIDAFLGLYCRRAAPFIRVPLLSVLKPPSGAHVDAALGHHVWRTIRRLVLARGNTERRRTETRRSQLWPS
jgi:hypothetical protein